MNEEGQPLPEDEQRILKEFLDSVPPDERDAAICYLLEKIAGRPLEGHNQGITLKRADGTPFGYFLPSAAETYKEPDYLRRLLDGDQDGKPRQRG